MEYGERIMKRVLIILKVYFKGEDIFNRCW